ncbi:MAG TPA: prepilin peptidase, partial [Pirellulales bacterium]|nr:prepilin peptidase [Pirellulales bacterium]
MFILCNVLLSDLASVDPATAWSLVVFAVAVGASIGSFMNVVVYRVPAGMSLLRPASRCPHCEHPIRATDNIPVLGWLRLRGRCRDCGARIARRYPLVELWVAVLFGAMAWADTIAGGFNLPGSFSDSQCWGIFAYHMFLLCSLLVVALIEFDGNEATTLIAAIGLVAVLLGAFFPALHPISPPLTGMRETLTAPPRTVALLDGLVGWVVGIVMGCVASPVTDRGPSGLKGRYSA